MFEPSPAEFVPSQQRGPDVAVYRIPGNPELCYEWSFKKLLSDKETGSYICCGCRSLKARDRVKYKDPLPLCKIKDGYFVTDPCFPARAHFCKPRSTPEVAMRRMVIKKCNDLREDTERRPTSSVVDELIGEVSGEGFDELSDASKQVMVEKLARMTESASRTLTRVFQWNMQKAQSPVAVPPGEEVKMKCALCESEQLRVNFVPIPSKKVSTIILLSCLARYNVVTLEDAKKHYKEMFATRKRICKNHFIQAVMFIGWEVEQLCGEFPLNGISEASPFVISSLLTNLRTYRGLLDDSMPMEKKDIREFFDEYMAEFHDEVTQRISTPGSVEGELFLQATANFDIKKEEDSSDPQITISEQPTDGRDADSPDFFVPNEELRQEEQDASKLGSYSSGSSSDEGETVADSELMMKCALCCAQRRYTQLRSISKVPQRNIIFLACMLLRKVTNEESATHIYKEFQRTQKRCCKQHYVDAAMTIQDELKKNPECLPNESRVPRFIPAELLQLLQEQGNHIVRVVLQARDVALFYSECLSKYHNGKDWELEDRIEALHQYSSSGSRIKATSRARKRRHEDLDEQSAMEPEATTTQSASGDASVTKGSNNKTTCALCCLTRNKIEFCRASVRADQHLILLSCLVLNGSFKTEVAQVMLREMLKNVQYICRKHFVLAMLYIYKSIKEKWNELATWTFHSLPDYIKEDLVNRIRGCANEIQKGFRNVEIKEIFVEKFYNSCEARYCVVGRLLAREGKGKTSKNAVSDTVIDGNSECAVAEPRKGAPRTVKYGYKRTVSERIATSEIQLSNSVNSFVPIPVSPRWLIHRTRPETKRVSLLACGLCGCVRLWIDVRKASSKAGRTNMLLACLLQQGLIDTKTASNFHKDSTRSQKRLCHEHFIHAGAYLASAVQKLTSHYPILGLWNIPFDMMDNIVATLQHHLGSISPMDTLIPHDVASFFNDYLLKYVESEEWKITEVQQPSSESDQVLDYAKDKMAKKQNRSQTANEMDEELFSNDVRHPGENDDSLLFCKEEKKEEAGIVISEQSRNTNEVSENNTNHEEEHEPSVEQEPSLEASVDTSSKIRCEVCDYRGTNGLRKPPTSRSYNVILIACMIMDGAIDSSQATDLFWKLTNFNVLICEKHFVKAVLRINKELEQIWGKIPSDGLDDVPCSKMYQFLEIIKSHACRIDLSRKTIIDLTDIRDFYDSCQMSHFAGEVRDSSGVADDGSQSDDVGGNSQEVPSSTNAENPSDSSESSGTPASVSSDESDGVPAGELLSSATDEVCGAELSFQEEIPATALLEQPIPHVDESLGTSGTNNAYRCDAFSTAAKNINESIDFRPIALFHFRQGLSVQTTTAEIIATFGEDSVTERKVREWFELFRTRHAQIAASAITPQAQAQDRLMKALLEADPNKTIPQLAQEFGAPVDTILSYLRMSGMLRNVRRTVLSERQRRNRMEICSGLILRQKREPLFLDRIITYGEVWMSNVHERRENVMAAVWWSSFGVIHHHLVPFGGRMTAQMYFYHVTEMHKKLLQLRREMVEKQLVIMLHDTQLPYISLGAIRNLHQLGYEILPFPANSSDLLPTDYHFVPQLRLFMADRVCASDAQLEKCIVDFINSKDVHFYLSGIYDLIARWKKCFCASGDYFKT
ncbi:hypothetical protein RB195_004545 [Necator americanus]|uniref:Mos1 transposase HTH domain-containing protein n=1 Tax=Necator americanus TaxID=51031 RepID=A0ABR1BII2_NECAM